MSVRDIIVNGYEGDVELTVGSDKWIAQHIHTISTGHEASEVLTNFFINVDSEKPHKIYQDRCLSMGVWPVWTLKDGLTVKPLGVDKGKAELRKEYPETFKNTPEWKVLCAYEVFRVTNATAKRTAKEAQEAGGKLADSEDKAGAGDVKRLPTVVELSVTVADNALAALRKYISSLELYGDDRKDDVEFLEGIVASIAMIKEPQKMLASWKASNPQ